jgi:SPP1 family predicted phage head-tail adaptor
MKIGDFRHDITIESFTVTRDPVSGEQIETWATYLANVPAIISPVTGKEYLSAGAEQAGITAKIIIRYDAGVTSKMRIVADSKTYTIVDLMPDPTLREYIVMMVKP